MHGLLHEIVKVGPRPARDAVEALEGRGQAFLSLRRDAQLRVLAEEVMTIALERWFLPTLPGVPLPAEDSALMCAYQELVLLTLSFELRELAVDVIADVLALVPRGFSRDLARRLDPLLGTPAVFSAAPVALAALLPHHST